MFAWRVLWGFTKAGLLASQRQQNLPWFHVFFLSSQLHTWQEMSSLDSDGLSWHASDLSSDATSRLLLQDVNQMHHGFLKIHRIHLPEVVTTCLICFWLSHFETKEVDYPPWFGAQSGRGGAQSTRVNKESNQPLHKSLQVIEALTRIPVVPWQCQSEWTQKKRISNRHILWWDSMIYICIYFFVQSSNSIEHIVYSCIIYSCNYCVLVKLNWIYSYIVIYAYYLASGRDFQPEHTSKHRKSVASGGERWITSSAASTREHAPRCAELQQVFLWILWIELQYGIGTVYHDISWKL